MNDLQLLLAVAGMALVVIVPLTAWAFRISKSVAVLRDQNERDAGFHDEVREDLKYIKKRQAAHGERLGSIEGELKRVNGKH